MKDVKFEVIRKIAEVNFKYKDLGEISRIDSISPPSVFIGSKLKYPLVNVGILSLLEKDENAWVYDDEKYWAEHSFEIGEVLKLRNSLLNSRFQSKVQDSRLNKKFVEVAKEVAIGCRPVDVEIELKNRMRFDRGKEKIFTPHGMRAPLKKAKVTSNVKVDKKVDRIMNDEVKASEGIEYLYKNKFSEYVLNKILSVGVLGLKKNKRLVPTRWSITATDDIIGKTLLKNVRDYKLIEDYEFFFGEFLGNQYLILLFPGVWSYELVEFYSPGSSWNPSNEMKASVDYESYSGRKSYAFATAGGYYATRLPILEYLNKRKRQAGVLVLRIETPSYWAGLGVWVVRESVRKALKKGRMKFASREELVEGAKKIGKIKFDFDYEDIFRRSKLLREGKEQKRLVEWV
ncbi:hypothetical protein CMI44_00940 [Candidatus Pacearchaeota archaeon]|nr:hypothetical protein [Candidatus Pacearchaeota archaeon]